MKIEARSTFERDVKKIKDRAVKQKIKTVIQDIQRAQKLADLNQVKKLAAHPHAYRIRTGNYRIGFYYQDQTVILARVKDREELYNFFPE